MNRRSLLFASALVAPAALLAGCATSTANGVTTITLNVASVEAWSTAFLNASTLIAGLPGIAGSGPSVVLMALANVIAADIASFKTAAGGNLSLTFDRTSVPKAITSLLADGQSLLTDTKALLSGVAAADAATAQTYLNAVATLVSLFEAALGNVSAKASGVLGAEPMTERQALGALGVK